jgi:hypothetical protein
MTQTRSFHIGDILSVTDGRLVSPRHIDGVYDILGWMTGQALMTHQLLRAMDECVDELRRQHPDLAGIVVPSDLNSEDALLAWLSEQVKTYGESREVAPLANDDHTAIDPLAELRMMRPDAQIVVIERPSQ